MKIKGTEWYTSREIKCTPIEGSDGRVYIQKLYGYRMPVPGRTTKELKELMTLLKSDGIDTKLMTEEGLETEIPAGTPFLQVSNEKSAIALENLFLKQGIVLKEDRYKEYGLKRINRPAKEVNPVVKKSFLGFFFGRRR